MVPALANDNSCTERVRDCEEVLKLADRAIDDKNAALDALSLQNQRLQNELDRATEALKEQTDPPWYRDGSVVGPGAFLLGVALGALAVNKAGR